MEHVLNFGEFMKDKCGGGIKEKIMCMKVWENLVEKLGVVNCAWCVKKKKKKYRKETHEKKLVKEKKSEKKEKFKSKECVSCGKKK